MAINFLDNLDLNANQLLDAKLQVDSTAPTATEGKIWFDSGSAKAFKYYNGTRWVDPAASGATYTLPAALVNSGQAKITLTGSDGTTDDVFFQTTTSNTTGTGGLALTGNSNSITYNINYAGSSGGYNNVINAATTSTASSGQGYIIRTNGDSTTSQEVVKTKMSDIPLSNFGTPTANISFNSKKITNLLDPTAAQDVATKAYVDASSAGSGALIFQGGYNAATNTPDLDSSPSASIKQGWVYVVTAAGNFFTEVVEVGDLLIADSDSPTALTDWVTVQNNIGLATTTVPGIASFSATNFNVSQAGAVSIKDTGVTAGIYGSASSVPRFTVSSTGQISAVATQSIYGSSDFASNVGLQVAARQKVLTSSNATTHTFTHNFGTYNVTCELYDTSSKETVFASIDRTSTNAVVATTSTAQSLTALIQKMG